MFKTLRCIPRSFLFYKNKIKQKQKDLISCKEKTFISHRGIGKARMDALKSWMEKHDLYFLG